MKVRDLSRFVFKLEESVEEGHCQEKCLVVTLEISEHLNHPVHHARTQVRCHFVSLQA
jgi:hypothetical protein